MGDGKNGKNSSCKREMLYLQKELGKGAMKTHVLKCNNGGEGKTNYFMIKVEGFYNKDYWLYIQVKDNATLSDLDSFLRDIWLECCNHLSAFNIGDTFYEDNIDYEDDIDYEGYGLFRREVNNMSESKLKDVLRVGLVFKYDYDFGSTTTLRLEVVEKYSGIATKDKITLLARNNMQEYICEKCGEKAFYIAMESEWSDYTPLCEKCMEDYEDEEAYVINITNSPRMGVCGYSGERDTYKLD